MAQQDNSVGGLIAQIGTEASAGAGGAADKRLRNTVFNLKNEFDNVAEYKGDGEQFVSNEVPGDAQATGDSSGPLSFTESCFVYDSALKRVTPAGPVNSAYTRVWRPGVPGVDTYRTYVLQKGNGRYNREWRYLFWNGFTLGLTRQEATLGGPLIAQPYDIVDAMTASPTKIANVLAGPTKTGLFYARSMAELESAPIRLTRNFEFTLEVTGFRNTFFAMNETLDTFPGVADVLDVDANLTMRLGVDVLTPTTVPARANTTAYLVGDVVKKAAGPHTVLFLVTTAGTSAASEPAAYGTATVGTVITDGSVVVTAIDFDLGGPFRLADIRSGQTFWVRAITTGPVIDGPTSTYYLHRVDVACQATDFPEDGDENGLATNTYNLKVVTDDVAGYPFEIKVVNKLAAF